MKLFIKALHLLPPELAHEITLGALRCGIAPILPPLTESILQSNVFGLDFFNPVGIAAGFDKNAAVPVPLLRWGFGFVEAGTVTPRPQPGNPQPRLFRIPSARAVINRLGFNNEGLEAYIARLKKVGANPIRNRGIVGANVGKNKDSTDAIADYVTGVMAVSPHADYVVINISSPNTPGLRGLQNKNELAALLMEVQKARRELKLRKLPPLLVKIAPDLDDQSLADIAETVMAAGVDGLILGNTTVARPANIPEKFAKEAGGLSGKPLFEPSNEVLKKMYRLLGGKMPIIGVGGISSAEDAYKKIRCGASLVQLYTALVYEGPALVMKINEGLADLLRRDGFNSVVEAVGKDA
jgi:dihydroorotate dehydrogenase